MMNQISFSFSGKREALLFLYVSEKAAFSCDCDYTTQDAFGNPAEVTVPGLYRLWFHKAPEPREITFCWEDGVFPFLIPGPGIVASHFECTPPALRFAGGQTVSFAIPLAPGQSTAYFAIEGYNCKAAPVSFFGDGAPISAKWYPSSPAPYCCTKVPAKSLISAKVRLAYDTRITVWEGNPMFLENAPDTLPMATLRLAARDKRGEALDARFEVYAGDELVLQRDVLVGEDCIVTLPEGTYHLRAHHGFRYSEAHFELTLKAGETSCVSAALTELLPLPRGWAWGDCHVHSVFEDAAPMPDQNLRAARATGSHFMFQTDKDVDELLAFGVSHADKDGVFVGMPGQEIMCHELHMNVLNTPWQVPEAYSPSDKVQPDICEKIGSWLAEIEAMGKTQPVGFMLNHPSHSEATRSRPAQGYFRSWWVMDRFPAFRMVENCDYPGWFDLLNRGERITALWTTDSHDCSRLYAGKKGCCVYVGDTLTKEAVINGLTAGHVFSARHPGAILLLSVNGASMGDIAHVGSGTAMAHVSARTVVPIETIEIIANGFVVTTIPGEGKTSLDVDTALPADAHWAMARLRLRGGDWAEDSHSFEPLMTAGFAAFTNPVYIERTEP